MPLLLLREVSLQPLLQQAMVVVAAVVRAQCRHQAARLAISSGLRPMVTF
jgi:hypothetical protein